MRFLGRYKKTRTELAADVSEVANLRLNIHADVACFEMFAATRELDVVARSQDFRVVINGNFIGLDSHITVRDHDIFFCVIDTLFLSLWAGCCDHELVLLCPEKQENI